MNTISVFEHIRALEGHEYPVVDVVIHEFPDDLAHIVSIDERANVRRWCAHSYKVLQTFHTPEAITGVDTHHHLHSNGQDANGKSSGEPGAGQMSAASAAMLETQVSLQAVAPLMLEWRNKGGVEPPHPGIVLAR